MTEHDLNDFTALLDSVSAMLSRGQYMPNEISTGIFFRTLAAYPMDAVRGAFEAHVRGSSFVPAPHDILKFLAASDGRPGPEEAWAIALRSRDERDTVIWTVEMGKAWDTARAVLAGGDEVGARVAFREAYNRHVDEARQRSQPVQWKAVMGHDPARRVEALSAAAKQGLVVERADELLADALLLLPAPRGVADPLLLPAPEPESEQAAAGRAAVRALVDRMRAAPVSRDSQAKTETAELRALAGEKAMAYAREHGLVLDHPPLKVRDEVRGEFIEARP